MAIVVINTGKFSTPRKGKWKMLGSRISVEAKHNIDQCCAEHDLFLREFLETAVDMVKDNPQLPMIAKSKRKTKSVLNRRKKLETVLL